MNRKDREIVARELVKVAKDLTGGIAPTILDMKIHLGQSGTSYSASTKNFQTRYHGSFDKFVTGNGGTPEKALEDLMDNVTDYFNKELKKRGVI